MDDEGGRLLMERPTDGQTENGDFIGPFIGRGSNNFLQTRKKKNRISCYWNEQSFKEFFILRNKQQSVLRYISQFTRPPVRSAYHWTESISYIRPDFWIWYQRVIKHYLVWWKFTVRCGDKIERSENGPENPANIYLFIVSKISTGKRCEICSK